MVSGDPHSDDPEPTMAIDFEVEPEFQEKLDWIDGFVREEIEPLDLYFRGTVSPFDKSDEKARRWSGHSRTGSGNGTSGPATSART